MNDNNPYSVLEDSETFRGVKPEASAKPILGRQFFRPRMLSTNNPRGRNQWSVVKHNSGESPNMSFVYLGGAEPELAKKSSPKVDQNSMTPSSMGESNSSHYSSAIGDSFFNIDNRKRSQSTISLTANKKPRERRVVTIANRETED